MVRDILIGVASGVVVAAVIAAVVYVRLKKEKGEAVEQIFVDELSIGEIKKWFEEKLGNSDQKGIVFYPTEENAEKWKIKMPEDKNKLIQIVYDEKAEKIVAYREIAFTELSEKLKKLLDDNGGTIVIDK